MPSSLMRLMLVCAFAAGCGAAPIDGSQGGAPAPTASKTSIFAECPGDQGAGVDVNVAAQTCEQEYGATNIRGKTYQIPCDCAPDSGCSNSDCYSNCFLAMLRCGQPDGRYFGLGCDGVDPLPPDPDYGTCSCAREGFLAIHNYWCCTNDPGQTIQGWSNGNYCG